MEKRIDPRIIDPLDHELLKSNYSDNQNYFMYENCQEAKLSRNGALIAKNNH